MVFPKINAIETFRCIDSESRILAIGRQALDISNQQQRQNNTNILKSLNSELYFGIQKTPV